MLPGTLPTSIERSSSDRLDTTNILKACLGQPGAVTELINSLHFFEGDSYALRDVISQVESLGLY
jgi:hypothetical protein